MHASATQTQFGTDKHEEASGSLDAGWQRGNHLVTQMGNGLRLNPHAGFQTQMIRSKVAYIRH
jgi:hypothetical protein